MGPPVRPPTLPPALPPSRPPALPPSRPLARVRSLSLPRSFAFANAFANAFVTACRLPVDVAVPQLKTSWALTPCASSALLSRGSFRYLVQLLGSSPPPSPLDPLSLAYTHTHMHDARCTVQTVQDGAGGPDKQETGQEGQTGPDGHDKRGQDMTAG